MQKLLIIVGPTASGKSAFGVELARRFDGEIISADSRQVYRGLDLGTGKITKREMRGVRHHLLDVASPKNPFTAYDFLVRARRSIKDIASRGRFPIIVGGTGFYIDTLVGRIALPDVPPDQKLRTRLQKKTAAQLYALLKKKDPKRAKALVSSSERNNKARLIRALEIAHAPGKDPSPTARDLYDILWIGLKPTARALEKKIAARLDERFNQGMVAEAKRLHKAGLSYKRMGELGLEYRSLARFLKGSVTHEEMRQELLRDIRRYAKKQLVYWKRNDKILWYAPTRRRTIASVVERWLSR